MFCELCTYVEAWVLQITWGVVVGAQAKSIQVKSNPNEIKQQNFICKTCP